MNTTEGENPMKNTIIAAALTATTVAGADNFDRDPTGPLPARWTCGVTGQGRPLWTIERDTRAPSPPNVLRQSGASTFAWCVRPDALFADGFVEVKFKPIAGRQDRAGGVVWRWKDGNTYYVARANALEDNVSLYHTQNGKRSTIKYVNAPVAANQWHVLRVEFSGTQIKVVLDGKTYIELEDGQISGPGAVGVWTKADSMTAFDDFAFGGN